MPANNEMHTVKNLCYLKKKTLKKRPTASSSEWCIGQDLSSSCKETIKCAFSFLGRQHIKVTASDTSMPENRCLPWILEDRQCHVTQKLSEANKHEMLEGWDGTQWSEKERREQVKQSQVCVCVCAGGGGVANVTDHSLTYILPKYLSSQVCRCMSAVTPYSTHRALCLIISTVFTCVQVVFTHSECADLLSDLKMKPSFNTEALHISEAVCGGADRPKIITRSRWRWEPKNQSCSTDDFGQNSPAGQQISLTITFHLKKPPKPTEPSLIVIWQCQIQTVSFTNGIYTN